MLKEWLGVALGTTLVVSSIVACGGATSSVGDVFGNGSGAGSSGSGSGSGTGTGTGSGTGAEDKNRDASAADATSVGRVPLVHRPAPVECTHVRGPGDADPNIQGVSCTTDGECTAGTNGRCLVTKVAAHSDYCSYDTCFTDAECGGKVCTCREASNDANRCAAEGNCKVDADCGGYCSPSVGFDRINFGVTGYWCHTTKDTCVDDSDCGTAAPAKCAFDTTKSLWACSTGMFLPP